MRTEKERKLNPKSGMALPAVIIILLIVALLGTAMYAYSYDSVQSIRYASNTKKAQYLARAGVEATASAYQLALSNPYSVDDVSDVLAAANNSEMTSNKVYLVYDSSAEDSRFKYRFVTEDEASSFDGKNKIGYYEVTVRNETNTITVDTIPLIDAADPPDFSDPNYEPETVPKQVTTNVKVITATGYAGNAKEEVVGCISGAKMAKGAYYGSNGIIDGQYTDEDGYNSLKTLTVNNKQYTSQATENFYQFGLYRTTANLYYKHDWLSDLLGYAPETTPITSRDIPIAVGYAAGNMIFDEPSSSNNVVSFLKGQDNIVTFMSTNNTFVRSDLDLTSSDGKFNFVTLKAKEIVFDGNIVLSAYSFTRNQSSSIFSNLTNNYNTLQDLMKAKYRYATLQIAVTDGYSDSVYDEIYPKYADSRNNVYAFESAGKVFFGGNVYVTIQMPNVGTHSYRAFSAGDAYYFDATPKKTRFEAFGKEFNSDQYSDSAGIDLMRYFLEKSIAEKKYSSNVIKRFADLVNFYYGSATDTATASGDPKDDQTIITKEVDGKKIAYGLYVYWEISDLKDPASSTGNIIYDSMRKIQPGVTSPTCYKYDEISDVVPPNPADASGITWGEPDSE